MRKFAVISAVALILSAAPLFVRSAAGGEGDAASPGLSGGPAGGPVTSYAPIIKRAAPSVVTVFSSKTVNLRRRGGSDPLRRFFGDEGQRPFSYPHKQQGTGSGVIVSSDGTILTNHHVIAGADEIKVSLSQGKKAYAARLVGSDPKTDVAVLKIDAKGLPAIAWGEPDGAVVGDIVFAIGNPLDVGQTVTMGIVSALGRSPRDLVDYANFIQTDAAVNQGNSGGALIDARGRLIGINTAILSPTGGSVGIGFAIPIRIARRVLQSILTTGKVRRGFLGVVIQDISPEMAEMFGRSDDTGAIVAEVSEGSAAEDAGIKKGDVVIEVNGEKVRDSSHLRLRVSQTDPGKRVRFELLRDGKRLTVSAKLGELKEEAAPAAAGESDGGSLLRGLALEELSADVRQQIRAPRSLQGVVVSQVHPAAPAARALHRGDVIMEINRQRVRNRDEFTRLADPLRDKKAVVLFVWSRGSSRYVTLRE